jgi:hypothetical protein
VYSTELLGSLHQCSAGPLSVILHKISSYLDGLLPRLEGMDVKFRYVMPGSKR